MLKDLTPNLVVAGELDSVEASVRYLQTAPKPDLIFMDIELGDGQSFDILNRVQTDVPVIFMTAYGEHALRAFKQNSIDYLLKPLNKADLQNALMKYKRLHAAPLRDANAVTTRRNRFLAKVGTRLTSVPIENIAYFFTRDKQLFIKTKSREDLLIDKCLDEIESETDNYQFFRANRQFIIHYDSIEKVQTWYSGKLRVLVMPASHEEIIVSRLKAPEFKKWLGE